MPGSFSVAKILEAAICETGAVMKKAFCVFAVVALTLVGGYAVGHSGGLDKNGCHTDHKNGGYHCH